MRADDLATVLLGDGPSGYGTSLIMGMYLTEWDAVTYENVVTDGVYTFTNATVLNPAALILGRVAVLVVNGCPLVLGNSYKYVPPAIPEV